MFSWYDDDKSPLKFEISDFSRSVIILSRYTCIPNHKVYGVPDVVVSWFLTTALSIFRYKFTYLQYINKEQIHLTTATDSIAAKWCFVESCLFSFAMQIINWRTIMRIIEHMNNQEIASWNRFSWIFIVLRLCSKDRVMEAYCHWHEDDLYYKTSLIFSFTNLQHFDRLANVFLARSLEPFWNVGHMSCAK